MQLMVLVVHDDPLLRATIGDALRVGDIVPVLAGADEALRRIRVGMMPDVVVIDLDMRDGSALLAELGCAIADLVPVVALSSRPRRLLAAGEADAVVMKPFEVGHLRQRISQACDGPRGAI